MESTEATKDLPKGFQSIEAIKKMAKYTFVNVIGFVYDYQPFIKTSGTDHKCTIRIKDNTSQNEIHGMTMDIFARGAKMEEISGLAVGKGDVLVIRQGKTQLRNGAISLMHNAITQYHLLRASNIPKTPPVLYSQVPWISSPPKGTRPNEEELRYVVWANQDVEQLDLPNTQEFNEKTIQALNVREKYSLLCDVKHDSYHDIVGEVRRTYGTQYDHISVYFTDYTGNSSFFNYVLGGVSDPALEGRDGDEYGYIKNGSKKEDGEWEGPYGKLTIQLTLFGQHADFIRNNNIKPGQWLLLRNVRFETKNTPHLEGKLREDRAAHAGKVFIEILDPKLAKEDPRLKGCLTRKLAYTKKLEQQKQKAIQEASSGKRKADGDPAPRNSKERRKEERRKAQAAAEAKAASRLNLNENVKCNYPDQTPTPLSKILTLHTLSPLPQYNGITPPFENLKYKANIRIVDYFPHDIRDFATCRRITEFDGLSDYSGAESDDDEDGDTGRKKDMRSWSEGKGFVERVWEWRFILIGEDADPVEAKKGNRINLIVGHQDAEFLLNIDGEACNLHKNPLLLTTLKEQLFKLWGDLEEQKSSKLALDQKSKSKSKRKENSSRFSSPSSSSSLSEDEEENDVEKEDGKERKNKNVLPPDTDDETIPNLNSNARKSRGQKSISPDTQNQLSKENQNQNSQKSEQTIIITPKNKPFTCCIKQYAVKEKIREGEEDERERERDGEKRDVIMDADAGEGRRWVRVFGMWGTAIM